MSASRKHTSSPSSTDSARHIASPLPQHRRRTAAAAPPPGGPPPPPARATAAVPSARGGVHDHDLVDRPRLAQLRERPHDPPHRPRALARGQAHRHAPARARPRSAPRSSANGGTCGLSPTAPQPSPPSPLLSQAVAIERTIEPWSALLDDGRADGRLVREAREGPGTAAPRWWSPPRSCTPTCSRRSGARASSGSTPTRRRRCTPRGRGRRSSPPGPPRASRCASTCPRSTSSAATPTRARSTSTRPRRSRRTRRARSPRFGLGKRLRPAIYDGDTPREARAQIRRRAERRAHQPRHAPRRHPPQPRRVGHLFANLAVVVIDEAHVYRGVFGSHVANVLRRLRRDRRRLRHRAPLPAHLRHDRQPARARRAAHRPGGHRTDRRGRLPRPAAADRDLEPAAHRRGARRAPLGARRGRRAARAARARRRARDLLHEVAQGRRAAQPARAGGARARAGGTGEPGRARGPLPRRLHPPAAARARGPPDARRAARGDHDRCAGARDRHRRARRRRGRHLPRHRRLAAPDVGARRAARARAWRCTSPARTRSTSSSAATPTSSSSGPSRPRSSTTRALQIHLAHLLCAAFEGPLSSDDAEILGPRWEAYAEMLAGQRRAAPAPEGGHYVPRRPGDYPAAAVSLRSASPEQLRDRRHLLRGAARHDRGRARALDGAPGRDLPAPRALLRGARARPRAPPRARGAVRRRLVHAAQARDRHHDRAPARPPRDARRHALLRRGLASPTPCSPTSAGASPTTRRSTS